MKQFNIGDEVRIINDTPEFLNHFTTGSPFIKHGSRVMKENKGIIVGEYKGKFAISYISDANKEVVLDFKPENLGLLKKQEIQYSIY